jgi:hypothetical protein
MTDAANAAAVVGELVKYLTVAGEPPRLRVLECVCKLLRA